MIQDQAADDYVVIAEFYDHIALYRDRQDVAFFVEQAQGSGGPVLEIGCGTGRVLFSIAQAGVEVVGLDRSASMLAVCKQKLTRESAAVQSRVRLVEADMRAFDLDRKFALVTMPFRPFQHLLEVADQLECLATVRRHLDDQGRLIVDVFNPYIAFLAEPCPTAAVSEAEFTMPDGRAVCRQYRVLSRDLARQLQEVEMVYLVTHPDGRRQRLEERFPIRYYFRFEMEHLLARAGFRVQALYGDYDQSPFGSKDPGELIFIAAPEW